MAFKKCKMNKNLGCKSICSMYLTVIERAAFGFIKGAHLRRFDTIAVYIILRTFS